MPYFTRVLNSTIQPFSIKLREYKIANAYTGEKKEKEKVATCLFSFAKCLFEAKIPRFKKKHMLVISKESVSIIPEEVKAKLLYVGVDV